MGDGRREAEAGSVRSAVLLAVALPVGLGGLVSLARVLWPLSRAGVPWSIDLAAAGVLGMLLGQAVLWRRAERDRAGWLVAVVAYGVAMPLVLLAVIILAQVYG